MAPYTTYTLHGTRTLSRSLYTGELLVMPGQCLTGCIRANLVTFETVLFYH